MHFQFRPSAPVGFAHCSECLFCISEIGVRYDYVEAREKINLPIYRELVRDHKLFAKLLTMLQKGTNLLIIEVDGPHGAR